MTDLSRYLPEGGGQEGRTDEESGGQEGKMEDVGQEQEERTETGQEDIGQRETRMFVSDETMFLFSSISNYLL